MRVLDVLRRDQPGEDDAEASTRPLGARRWGRISLRIAKIGLVVVLVLAAAVGVLFVLTPSAGEATSLVQDQAQQHGIAYPGAPVPQYFAHALVATEDKRFYSDPGVDPLAISRVILAKMTGKQDQGGSTIAQQLAKMLYTQGRSGAKVLLEQVTLAIKLNMTYSKTQILQMYSEVAYYGHGYYGLEQASCGYFGHQPADLTLVQAAMLAGAVNAPTFDDPLDHPAQARARLVHVLGRMEAVGYLTQAQQTAALKAPLGLSATRGC
ncbi:MAG TPA: biosynthetic peptidoglycan transglycosylase [Streptosporangiaceae bacterium]